MQAGSGLGTSVLEAVSGSVQTVTCGTECAGARVPGSAGGPGDVKPAQMALPLESKATATAEVQRHRRALRARVDRDPGFPEDVLTCGV